tara:strand:+ start:130 stop:480 length:351 start_codon:yes stop_codon:yes gene_type:complete
LKRINLYRALFISSIICISYLAFMPAIGTASILYFDKFLHFLTFFILIGLLDLSTKRPLSRHLWLLFFLVSYGFCIEVVQFTLPYRTFEIFDFIFDLMGILVYLIIVPKLIVKRFS